MKLPFVKDKPWPEEHPHTWYQAYPRYLYHHKFAPEGKVFKSPEETVGLKRKGWVDNPAKFPKPSKLKPWWEGREWWFKALAILVPILGGIVTILAGILGFCDVSRPRMPLTSHLTSESSNLTRDAKACHDNAIHKCKPRERPLKFWAVSEVPPLDPADEAAIELLEELRDSLPEVEEMIESEAWTTLEGAIYHLSMDVALRYAAPTPQGEDGVVLA